MPLPTNLSYLGIAKEATKGTGVAPTDFIPIDAGTFKPSEKIHYFEDDALRGSMASPFNIVAGPQWTEIAFGGPLFPDTFGYILAGLLGECATTGASAPFTHTMNVLNSAASAGQPKAYTLTDFYGLTSGTPARQYPGMQFSEIVVKFNGDGTLDYTAKAMGFASALVAKPTASFSTVPPTPAWKGTLTVAGGAKTFLQDGTLTFKRNVTAVHTVDGSAAPYALWVGALSVDGTLTYIHEDDTELTRFLTNTQPTVVLDFVQGAGAALTEFKTTFTTCAYVTGDLDRSKDYVSSIYKISPVANTTDVGASGGYSPMKAVIQSAKPAATYL